MSPKVVARTVAIIGDRHRHITSEALLKVYAEKIQTKRLNDDELQHVLARLSGHYSEPAFKILEKVDAAGHMTKLAHERLISVFFNRFNDILYLFSGIHRILFHLFH